MPRSKKTRLSGQSDRNIPGESADKKEAPSQLKFPIQMKHENSVVQVFVTSYEAHYDEPWKGSDIRSCTGSGSVIEHGGEKFVLTNAHCVENQIRTQVRLANNRQEKYYAEPICVSYQCDLALLRIRSQQFQTLAQPVELGDMIGIHDEIVVNGFPMGGDEISVTKGIVSRIEVQQYAMSDLDMLQAQVDAAINPGNSGGAAFSGGKLVGVPFQGIRGGEALGYIIPMPIVKHFLNEAFSGRPYRGFPILPIDTQKLENKWQRLFYGMTKKQTGVLVTNIASLSDAYQQLNEGDILLEIDGHKISNHGSVDIPGIGKCIDLIHITHMKYIDDIVRLKVLRKDEDTGIPDILDIEVTLDSIPHETEVIPPVEHDKMPTYYINSGFVFVPVTRNYLERCGLDLRKSIIDEDDPEDSSLSVSGASKKNPNQQYVAINTVLDCRTTVGYGQMAHHLVYKVNGIIVNNIQGLIKNMETYQGSIHLIETRDKETIALKKLPPVELKKIMDAHKIAFDRSEDLRPGSEKKNVLGANEDSSTDSLSSMSAPQEDAELNEPAAKVTRGNHVGHGRYAMFAHSHALVNRGSRDSKKLRSELDNHEDERSLKRHQAEPDGHELAHQL